jgi:hypothetical protein
VSPRIGPLVAAVLSMTARLAGEPAIAEAMGLTSFALLTLVLQRSAALRAATRSAHTLALISPLSRQTTSPAR